MTVDRQQTRRGRHGYAVLEIVVSSLVLMGAMSLTVRVLSLVGNERRAAEWRQAAVQTVSNVMERAAAEPFDRLSAEHLRSLAGDSAPAGATWEVTVDDDRTTPLPSKRVSLALLWTGRSGGPEDPVRLTSWVFRPGGAR